MNRIFSFLSLIVLLIGCECFVGAGKLGREHACDYCDH